MRTFVFVTGNISTHAPRTGSDYRHGMALQHCIISTHAPRTGSDVGANQCHPCIAYFNPRSPHGERHKAPINSRLSDLISTHAPRTGSDKYLAQMEHMQGLFQPTLPARGATLHAIRILHRGGNFNPRSPHGERRLPIKQMEVVTLFQPTLPARGATAGGACGTADLPISTHAPRTGSDSAK